MIFLHFCENLISRKKLVVYFEEVLRKFFILMKIKIHMLLPFQNLQVEVVTKIANVIRYLN